MATTINYTCSTCFKPSGTGSGCIPISTPGCDDYFRKIGAGARTSNFAQIASAWIVRNNPSAVRGALVSTGLVANTATANGMTSKQLTDTLYQYYLRTGKINFAKLLSQIPVMENISASESNTLANASADLAILSGANPATASVRREGDPSVAKKWWEQVIDVIVGGSETTTEPVVVTTTKISPLAIGFAIAGVLVLGIIAWVIVKK